MEIDDIYSSVINATGALGDYSLRALLWLLAMLA